MLGLGIWGLFQIGGLSALEMISRLNCILYSGFESTRYQMFCNRVLVLHPFRKYHGTALAKKGADVNRLLFQNSAKAQRSKDDQCKKLGLRLGVSDGRDETQVYRTREYTGSQKMRPTLRKSRITTQIEPTALGRHAFCLRKSHAGDAPAFHFPVEGLRPCSRFIWPLYARN